MINFFKNKKRYFIKIITKINAPKELVIWNILDFAHVNWVHKKHFKNAQVHEKKGHKTKLSYEINHNFFFKIPFIKQNSKTYLFDYEYLPPNIVTAEASYKNFYYKTTQTVNEYDNSKEVSELIYELESEIPIYLHIFKPLINIYIKLWHYTLRKEESEMIERRYKVLKCGFKDFSLDVLPYNYK